MPERWQSSTADIADADDNDAITVAVVHHSGANVSDREIPQPERRKSVHSTSDSASGADGTTGCSPQPSLTATTEG
jgi:hypothetical protein